MWGALLRYGIYALFGALFSAITERVMTPLINEGIPQAHHGDPLYNWLWIVSRAEHVMLVILFACALGVIYRAVLERRAATAGRVPR